MGISRLQYSIGGGTGGSTTVDLTGVVYDNTTNVWESVGEGIDARAKAQIAGVALRRFNGTELIPSNVTVGDTLGRIGFGGYPYPGATGLSASLRAVASENFDAALAGSKLVFAATTIGDEEAIDVAELDADFGLHQTPGVLDTYNLKGGAHKTSALAITGEWTHDTENPGLLAAADDDEVPGILSGTALLIARRHVFGLPVGSVGIDGLSITSSAILGPRATGVQIENSYVAALATRGPSTAIGVQEQSATLPFAQSDGSAFSYTGGAVSGANVSFTIEADHGIPVGAEVIVAGSADASFDGTYAVTATTSTTVTALKGTAVGTSASGQVGVSMLRSGIPISFCAVPQGFAIGGINHVNKFGTEFGFPERFSDNPALWCIDGGTWDFDPREALVGFRSLPYLINANPAADPGDLVLPNRRAIWINRVTTTNNNALVGLDAGIRVDYLDTNALAAVGIINGSPYCAPSRWREITVGTANGATATVTVWSGHNMEVGDRVIVFNCDNDDFEGQFTLTAVTTTTVSYALAHSGTLIKGDITILQRIAASDTIDTTSEVVFIDSTAARTCNATHPLSSSAINGQRCTIHNIGSFNITIPMSSFTASASGIDVVLVPSGFATFYYRADTAVWTLESINGRLQAVSVVTGPNGLSVYSAANDANPAVALNSAFGAGLFMGAGGASAADISFLRTAARTVRMAGAGATIFQVHNSTSDSLLDLRSTGFGFYDDADDAQPKFAYSTATAALGFGAGGASAVDVVLTRSGAGTLVMTGSLQLSNDLIVDDDTTHTGDTSFTGPIFANRTNPDRLAGYLQSRYPDFLEEFWGTNSTSGQIGTHGWTATVANTATVTAGTGYGTVALATVTTAGAATINNTTMAEVGSDFDWEWIVSTPTIATVNTQDYELYIGWGNTTNAEPTNGYYFKYDVDTSANWITVTAAASSYTRKTSSTAFVASAAVRLRCQRRGTTVTFYVNDTLVGTHSNENNPAALSAYAPMACIVKEAGATSRTLTCDSHHFTVQTAR